MLCALSLQAVIEGGGVRNEINPSTVFYSTNFLGVVSGSFSQQFAGSILDEGA